MVLFWKNLKWNPFVLLFLIFPTKYFLWHLVVDKLLPVKTP